MKPISVVITDLDDTLWDWVDIWHKSFKAMLDRLESDSGISRDELIRDFKSVFERHGTTEYAFAIEELKSLQEKHPGEDLSLLYKDSIKAYRIARKDALHAYPTVPKTLETLRERGVLLVGYTESLSFYTRYRLRKLGLDCLLDYLYSPEDHNLPENIDPRKLRYYPPECYSLRGVIHRFTPPGKLKPSEEVLEAIINDIGSERDKVVYIGDKLHKDVLMAKRAKVVDVWAKYGEAKDRADYELLRRVTHWSEEAVQKEKDTTAKAVKPTYTLKNYFSEILEHFEFAPFVDTTSQLLSVVEVWKKTIDVQQHFNDIELRIRNFAITVLLAAIAGTGFALKEGLGVLIFGVEIPLASILMFAGALGLIPLWFMDRHWYHRLLYGAVNHAISIEKRHMRSLPEMGLSQKIKDESPLRFWRWDIHTTRKLNMFYFIIGIILIGGAVVAFFCRVPPTKQPAIQNSSAVTLREALSRQGAELRPQVQEVNRTIP